MEDHTYKLFLLFSGTLIAGLVCLIVIAWFKFPKFQQLTSHIIRRLGVKKLNDVQMFGLIPVMAIVGLGGQLWMNLFSIFNI